MSRARDFILPELTRCRHLRRIVAPILGLGVCVRRVRMRPDRAATRQQLRMRTRALSRTPQSQSRRELRRRNYWDSSAVYTERPLSRAAVLAAIVTVALLPCSAHAGARDPFSQLLRGRFQRIKICGYGDGRSSKGLPDEKVLAAACAEGRDSFAVEVTGLETDELESIVKTAVRESQAITGEQAHLPTVAMVTILLTTEETVSFFVMTTGELRSGAARVMPRDRAWLRQLTARICKALDH